MRTFLVLMCSISRKDRAEYKTLSHLLQLNDINKVYLFGDCPKLYFPNLVCLPLKKTMYHKAYSILPEKYKPVRFTCAKKPWCGIDAMSRALWRTKLSLDMLSVLLYANRNLPKNSEFVWLENDVKFFPEKIPNDAKAPFSCWGKKNNYSYQGDGALCFVFVNDESLVELIRCIIGKHMTMPVDWIISDCINMRQYDASKHLGTISTRIQSII